MWTLCYSKHKKQYYYYNTNSKKAIGVVVLVCLHYQKRKIQEISYQVIIDIKKLFLYIFVKLIKKKSL